MFPRFENLQASHTDRVRDQLEQLQWADPQRSATDLVELRSCWEEIENSVGDTDPDWYIVLRRILPGAMNPGATLNAALEYVRATQNTADAFHLFAKSPRSLDIISRFATGSPWLTQILLRDPAALRFLTAHRRLTDLKTDVEFFAESDQFLADSELPPLAAIRQYQQREQLRIGLCDVFGLLGLQHITLQLSQLADAMIHSCLRLAIGDDSAAPFAVLALGKLGGKELNYSSDVDLILVGTSTSRESQLIGRRMVDGLAHHLPTGFLYRVDLRLRPWGGAGPLVTTPDAWFDYLKRDAKSWEKQALLKARFVAGDASIAADVLNRIPAAIAVESEDDVRRSVLSMKDRIESFLNVAGRNETEVKLGQGSIRDVEFLVQSMQLIHGLREPRLHSPNTLDALVRLADFGHLEAADFQKLRDGYVFLRAVEHAMQLQHNQQTHEIPQRSELREWLALRVDYPDAETFMKRFHQHRHAVRSVFDRHLRPQATITAEVSPVTSDETLHYSQPDVDLANAVIERLQTQLMDAERTAEAQADVLDVAEDEAALLVAAVDHPDLLPMISGLLFSLGLDVRWGTVVCGPGSVDSLSIPADFVGCQLRVGAQSEQLSPAGWINSFREKLRELLAQSHSEGQDSVRDRLVELFCERIEVLSDNVRQSTSLDVTDCVSDARDATIVSIESPDCPGFLFELTNALRLCGFCIRGADIRVTDRTARDTFVLTEFGRRAPLEPERIRELHTVVVLIQQFTQWLQSSADPATALVRFRQLLRALIRAPDQAKTAIILQNPEVLRKVARVLGLSRHLWEDALRHQGLLIPWLADPDVLAESVSGGQLCADFTANEWSDLNDFRSAILHLNQSKDRQLFRIELRHVLGHTNAFGEFSREVTELAEAVLLNAAELAWEEFEKDSPAPACAWTLAGLGKLGGIEMGYASDIELLLIYDAVDQGSARWFERLLRRVKSIVQTRYDGIFDIDLRMRPWGQAGSAAVPLQQFREYYSAEGNAWPFERQAMIKLRPFGPDRKFGERVTALRDRAIYDGRKPDLLAMQGLREEQVRQHVRPSTIHAKLSEGCLVDLEYAVQGLQLRFGHKYPELRSSNTADAILVAGKLELITAEQLQKTLAAHQYLRQLIDCLRMVRGNARDLMVPEPDTPQGYQLTRRLKLMYGDEMNLTRLAVHQDTVQRLIRAANAHCS